MPGWKFQVITYHSTSVVIKLSLADKCGEKYIGYLDVKRSMTFVYHNFGKFRNERKIYPFVNKVNSKNISESKSTDPRINK